MAAYTGAIVRSMADKRDQHTPKHGPDERLSIPLDPEEALRALLDVDPGSQPSGSQSRGHRRSVVDAGE
jgi:hypothetical protein